MIYGDIYSKLSAETLNKVSGINREFLKFGRMYFKFFGYPDVAGGGRFPIVLGMLKPQKGEKILDAGCGNGIYANSIAYYFCSKVIGCDLDKKRVKIAQQIANCLKIEAKFSAAEIEKITFPKNYFDKIICIEVIEHIQDDEQLIKKFNSFLKKGGILVLSTAKREELAELEEEKRFKNVKKGKHVRSGYEFNELKEKLENSGFKVLKFEPYYRFFSRIVIKVQQKIYKKNLVFLNLLTFPFFSLFAKLDYLIPPKTKWNNYLGWYRGFIIKAVKK